MTTSGETDTGGAESDAQLIERARAGADGAVAELYRRHEPAGRRLAASYPRAGAPDDVVHDAFQRILTAIRNGAGPTESFRAYLFVTIRRVAAAQIAAGSDEPLDDLPEGLQPEADQVIDLTERTIVLDAYGSLPDRMQTVLWQTEVEGRPPRELAPALGMSANAVAALVSRARERLRQAYLQAHLQVPADPGCAPHRQRLGEYVRRDGAGRSRSATADHVAGCAPCAALVAELTDVNRLFARAVLPWFVVPGPALAAAGAAGVGAAGVAAAEAGGLGGAGGAAGGSAISAGMGMRRVGRRVVSKARANPAPAGAVGVAAVVAVAALAVAAIGHDTAVPPAAAPPAIAAAPDRSADEAPLAVRSTTAPLPVPTTAAPPSTTRPESMVPSSTVAPSVPPPAAAASPVAQAPPPATVPPTTMPPPPAPPPPAPPTGPVVWLPDSSVVRITLANSTGEPTAFLIVRMRALGGAVVIAPPTGCGLAASFGSTALCAVRPLDAGASRVVDVPTQATGLGQSAEVTVCSASFLRLDCETSLIPPTTVPVT